MALTDKEIQGLKPKEKKYKVFDGDGLYLLIHPKYGKYWYLQYHIAGRQHEVAFGTYPTISLKLAREKREEARQQLAKGLNPRVVKKSVPEARSVLFGGIADEWIQMMSTPAESNGEEAVTRAVLDPATVKKHRWLADNYLKPALGKSPIAQISAGDFLPLLKGIEEQGKSETAHRVRALASRIFCYAHSTGRAPQGDVTTSLRDALAPAVVVHHATITDPEKVGELLLVIDSYTGLPETRCALKLAPLVMLRPREPRFGEWSEISFEKAEWRIPAVRMKMDTPHIVPLSKQALVILYDLKKSAAERGRFMFPVLGSKDGVMSDNTLTLALRTLGYGGNVMTVHGFRSMASTLLNEQQLWHSDAIERQLAHAPRNKVRAAYNYAEHLPERRRMMQAWADYLDELREAAHMRRSKQHKQKHPLSVVGDSAA
jgi:integrase